ncbi:flagellar assembly protein FliH [Bacillus infantis]|uniref:Flagellar assembly protein FliH n=1 Tax=Bacillus infantis TaxID=324767 RepID=A0A5D4R7P5_9BACI|nr:flagellar assembly protein FliH [Bacillus infantis]TYS46630.1 flagellar assembly protein FliH [Bacillus infantis]
MISLSRLIKSHWAQPSEQQKKVISIKLLNQDLPAAELQEEAPFNQQLLIDEARREAESIIQQANEEARQLMEHIEQERVRFEQEKEEARESARLDGFQAGLAEGRQSGFMEFSETIGFAKEIVESSKADYQNTIESSEGTILDIGIKVAERILSSVLEEDSSRFLPVVKRALKESREYREVQLHVHPGRYSFLLEHKDELLAIYPRETNLYIYPDEELEECSCVIESPGGRINAGVDSQLEEMKRKLIELLESENN